MQKICQYIGNGSFLTARVDALQLLIPYDVRVLQVVLGKPAAWPALVLNTTLRKPVGQLPLAEVRLPDVIDVPDVPGVPEMPDVPDVPELEATVLLLPLPPDDFTRLSPAALP